MNIRIKHAGGSFPLSPVEKDFDHLDHVGLPRPGDSVRVHDKAVEGGFTHTYLSPSRYPDKRDAEAVIATGWEPLVFLGAVQVRVASGKKTSFVYGTRKT